ncbi:MAG: general secretion pathway protein GspK [Candidatus Hydrogenedentota bacterium]|nr:MAG: general secretion pathway protein GspK [Candidatus Hydrogenedentota bacterium]
MCAASSKKGLVLVAVLWVVVLLIVISATVGRNSRLDTKVRVVRTDDILCQWTCRAGIEKAIAVLNDDLKASDSLNDLWSENDVDFNDVQFGECIFNVSVIDEAAKLNLNTASREQLLRLEEEGMTEEIADAILDWRDEDDDPKQGGAEIGYYENLRYGYKIRNGQFKTIRELLLVKGINEHLLYGEDTNLNGMLDYNEKDGDESPPLDNKDDKLDQGFIAYFTCYSYDRNRDASGMERTNINQGDEESLARDLSISRSHAKWIVENRDYGSIADLIKEDSREEPPRDLEENPERAVALDLQTFKNIADKITVNDEGTIPGRININTAPREVLIVLLGGDEDSEEIADGIITYRDGLTSGMESIGELLNAESVNVKTFKEIANFITTRSDVFTIQCVARTDRGQGRGTRLKTEAVVDRSRTPCKILYQYQGAGPTMLAPAAGQVDGQ